MSDALTNKLAMLTGSFHATIVTFKVNGRHYDTVEVPGSSPVVPTLNRLRRVIRSLTSQ